MIISNLIWLDWNRIGTSFKSIFHISASQADNRLFFFVLFALENKRTRFKIGSNMVEHFSFVCQRKRENKSVCFDDQIKCWRNKIDCAIGFNLVINKRLFGDKPNQNDQWLTNVFGLPNKLLNDHFFSLFNDRMICLGSFHPRWTTSLEWAQK